jgi:hypothetical protein
VDEVSSELVNESAESAAVNTPEAEGPVSMSTESSPPNHVDNDTSNQGYSAVHEGGSTAGEPLSVKYERVLAQIVTEKRNYDFFVNRVTRRLAEVTAGKNRAQNELTELVSSVSGLLSEISRIEKDPGSVGTTPPVSASGIRGPPLPSQDELFMKAWDQGQVGSTYSRFSQRKQYSSWKSSY